MRIGATIAIVSGKGAGQWATVTSVSGDGHTVYTNKPWIVTPAAGSTYATFDWGAANWIIAGNNLSNNDSSTFTTSGGFIKAEIPLRPRVLTFGFGYKF